MSELPRSEIIVYFLLWSACFVYTLVKVYEGGNLLKSKMTYPGDFSPGWGIFYGREKDVSDSEWSLWASLTLKLIPWLVLHLTFCESARRYDVDAVPLVHFIITITVVALNFHLNVLLIFIFHFLIIFVAMVTGGRKFIWTVAITMLVALNFDHTAFEKLFNLKPDKVYLFVITMNWFHIRCVDFTLSELETNERLTKKFLAFLGFAFYLPCFFLGPLLPYESFKENLNQPNKPWDSQRVLSFVTDLSKVAFWFLVHEIFSHFLYCHAMHDYVEDLFSLGYWIVDGVGLCMAQFFYVKYVVIYGFSIAVVKAELYKAPPKPRCVNRIYLYSDMWRHFDRGFYLFLFKHIYRPVCGEYSYKLSRRLFASFLCFCFVFLWHGVNLSIFIWSLLNFLGVAFEAAGRMIANTETYKNFEMFANPRNMRRFKAVVCSPLWIMAIVSNFIFFGGHTLGMIYVNQVLGGDAKSLFPLLIIGYLMCQVSMETSLRQRKTIKSPSETS